MKNKTLLYIIAALAAWYFLIYRKQRNDTAISMPSGTNEVPIEPTSEIDMPSGPNEVPTEPTNKIRVLRISKNKIAPAVIITTNEREPDKFLSTK